MTNFLLQLITVLYLYTIYSVVACALGLAAVQPLGRVRALAKVLHGLHFFQFSRFIKKKAPAAS